MSGTSILSIITTMNKEKLPEIVLGIVTSPEERVLIVKRVKEEKGTGNVKLSWVFPGGKVEQGETKEQAVAREVFEETGYRVGVESTISERKHPQFPVYVYYIECVLQSEDKVGKILDKEIKEAKWVTPSDLKDYFTTNLDSQVSKYLGL